MTALATRLRWAVVGTTAATVALAAVALWLTARATLVAGIDRHLDERLDDLDRRTAWRPDPRSLRNDPRRVLEVVGADGRVLVRSLTRVDGPVRWRERRLDHAPAIRDAVIGEPGARLEPPLTVRVGEDLAPTQAQLVRLASLLAILWAAATSLAWLAASALGRAVLRPLADLDRAVARLGPDDLDARLPADAGPAELRAITARLNSALERMATAFRREQATIAHIAHELRNPVAALRAAIEFRQLTCRDDGERAFLEGCRSTAGRLGAIIDDLLLLARLEAGSEPVVREAVDLAELVRAAAARHDLAVQAETAPLVTARRLAALIVDNLIDNAVRHRRGGAVVVQVDASGLTVANDCAPGIDPAQLGRPFYRADAARRSDGHAGLGLALAVRLARLLGLDLVFTVADGRFTARLRAGTAEAPPRLPAA